jgi:hypothetical protein
MFQLYWPGFLLSLLLVGVLLVTGILLLSPHGADVCGCDLK